MGLNEVLSEGQLLSVRNVQYDPLYWIMGVIAISIVLITIKKFRKQYLFFFYVFSFAT